MYLDNVIGFKKLKSETRIVNYEFDQLDRFVENSIFLPSTGYHHFKILCCHCSNYQDYPASSTKTDVKRSFIQNIFYDARRKNGL